MVRVIGPKGFVDGEWIAVYSEGNNIVADVAMGIYDDDKEIIATVDDGHFWRRIKGEYPITIKRHTDNRALVKVEDMENGGIRFENGCLNNASMFLKNGDYFKLGPDTDVKIRIEVQPFTVKTN